MKKTFLIIFILFSVFGSAQTPPGYTKISARYDWLAGKFDTAFHVPGYSTVPNIRVGAWVGAGNIGIDTILHRYYFYSGGSWIRLANFSDLGSFITTRDRFGFSGEDDNMGEDRTPKFHGTRTMNFDSVNGFNVYRSGLNRLYVNNISSGMFSPDGTKSHQVSDAVVQMNANNNSYIYDYNDSIAFQNPLGSYSIYNLPHVIDTVANKIMTWNSSTKKWGWGNWLGGGGSTPTLQQVTDAGNITTNSIIATHVLTINGDNNSAAAKLNTDNFGGTDAGGNLELKTLFSNYWASISPINSFSAAHYFKLAENGNGSGTDTIATLNDVRAGGGGSYTDEQAQDAIGAMIDGSLNYVDGTPLLQRSALTGDVTASAGSNSTTIANNAVTFAKMQAITDNRLLGAQGGTVVEEIALTANDFDLGSNTLSIDYTNGQAGSGSTKGFITSTDWTTFNNKETGFTEVVQEFTGSTSLSITLSNTPKSGKAEMYYLNGIVIQSSNISRTGTGVTFSGFTRASSDIITSKYSY